MTIAIGFERVVPMTVIDIQRPDLDSMLAGIADDLRWRIEAHRLAVKQSGGEDVGIVIFDPGRDIDQDGETGGMAFRKAISSKALDLIIAPLSKVLRITFADHALDQLFLEDLQLAWRFEGRHGAAQGIRFARGAASRDDGNPHCMFLV